MVKDPSAFCKMDAAGVWESVFFGIVLLFIISICKESNNAQDLVEMLIILGR